MNLAEKGGINHDTAVKTDFNGASFFHVKGTATSVTMMRARQGLANSSRFGLLDDVQYLTTNQLRSFTDKGHK